MNPYFALFLGIAFVVFLFWVDRGEGGKVSKALWIPLTWTLIIGSRPVSTWLVGISSLSLEDALLEGSPIDRAVYLILIALAFVVLIRRKIRITEIILKNASIMLLFLYALISITWSEFPFVSFKRWIKSVGGLSMVVLVLSENDPKTAIKYISRRCAYVLIPLSIVLYKYFLQLSRGWDMYTGEQTIKGISYNKNGLGYLCLICGLVLYWEMTTRKESDSDKVPRMKTVFDGFIMGLIFFLLFKSNSITSLVTLVVGIAIIYSMRFGFVEKRVGAIGLWGGLFFGIYVALDLTIGITPEILTAFGRDVTLTGRTALWKELLGMGTNSMFGVGFENFWLGERLDLLWARHQWMPNQAHNGYIELYLNLGITGLTILFFVLVSVYRKALRIIKTDYAFVKLRIAMCVILLLYNITEAAFFKGTHMVWFFFLLTSIIIPDKDESFPLTGVSGTGT